MKRALPLVIIIVAATAVLIFLGLAHPATAAGTVGVASGTALPGFNESPATADQALSNFLLDIRKRNWGRAFSGIVRTNESLTQQQFTEEWLGENGGLRSYSSLENYELRPLHATDTDADMRAHLHWATPVGPVEDVRDFHLKKQGSVWKVVWDENPLPDLPAQIVPVNYLRWDLVSGNAAGTEWGTRNVDAPHVRIVSMNAVNSAEGSIVMGEVVNEDTVPAFVNVTATLVDASGNPIDDESSFDKILHVLLPKQVSPYRIDFPHVDLGKVKNVRMNVKASLVPASSDPVIGVMNQKLETDAQGHSILHGDLMNEGGQTVNIPHVIASFYDSNGKVVWVSDGYVEQALLPQSSRPFAVEIPKSLAGKVQNFHVVVNEYSQQRS